MEGDAILSSSWRYLTTKSTPFLMSSFISEKYLAGGSPDTLADVETMGLRKRFIKCLQTCHLQYGWPRFRLCRQDYPRVQWRLHRPRLPVVATASHNQIHVSRYSLHALIHP